MTSHLVFINHATSAWLDFCLSAKNNDVADSLKYDIIVYTIPGTTPDNSSITRFVLLDAYHYSDRAVLVFVLAELGKFYRL